jgi:hypothetical protein
VIAFLGYAVLRAVVLSASAVAGICLALAIIWAERMA